MIRTTVGTLKNVIKNMVNEAVLDASVTGYLDDVGPDDMENFPVNLPKIGTKAMIVTLGTRRVPVFFPKDIRSPGSRISMLMNQHAFINGRGYFRDDLTYILEYDVDED